MEEEVLIRLNKYLAHAKIGNRRVCDGYIIDGLVEVNGEIITQAGTKVKMSDVITYRGEIVHPEKKVYILLNKPKNISCFNTDEQKTKSVFFLTKSFSIKLKLGYSPNLKPIDILDIDERGLILLTNDDDLIQNIGKNKNVEKIFHIKLNKELLLEDYNKILEGFKVSSGSFKVKELTMLKDELSIGIKIQIANTKILIDLFNSLSYDITFLDRTVFRGLTKRDLPRGHWRFLKEKEIIRLKY